MRVRLRPAHTPAELAALYPAPHDHTQWPDHRLRVNVTAGIAQFMHTGGTVGDLSCGDATIPRSVHASRTMLGDLAPGYPICGPIEDTIRLLPHVDLFICCETLEHLDDPDTVLRQIRRVADALVLSTPAGETTATNPEHYWGWDETGLGEMLAAAGFETAAQVTLDVPGFAKYQIWGCR